MLRKEKILIITVCAVLFTAFTFAACDTNTLSPPAKLKIGVEGLKMTVTWDAAANAQGYNVVLTSLGCGSGNRTINTKTGTSVVTGDGNKAANVEIVSETALKIMLMAAADNPDIAMADSLTAKAMSLGGTVSGNEYADSKFSGTVKYKILK